MQHQYNWTPQVAWAPRPVGMRNGGWNAEHTSLPHSFPGSRPAGFYAPAQSCDWQQPETRNEDYGNLVYQGFGPAGQGDYPVGSPETDCCSPPGPTEGWISPMDGPELYVSPQQLQSSHPLPFGQFVHAPSFSGTSQGSYSDSEEETVSARSPDSGSFFARARSTQFQQTQVFEMDLDEPSTTVDDDDQEEETTIDDAEAYEEPDSDDLDTTVDYSFLRGALDSHLGPESFPVTLNASKTPCLDALAFCVVMRLGAYQTAEDELEGSITITNFQKFLIGIHQFCPKKSQTANEEARIKALKRWFEGIPTKRKRDTVFVMRIKDRKNPVVIQIIKKMQRFCIAHGYVKAVSPYTQQVLTQNLA